MRVQKLVRAAVIAAVYATLCLVLQPISYGAVQLRVAEALTLLPVFCPEAVAGVTLGCLIANLLGGSVPDMVFGTLATGLAALCTRALRGVRVKKLPLASAAPPVVFNAVVLGIMFTVMAGGGVEMLLFNMATVGAGQLLSCCLLGLPLVWLVERTPALHRLFSAQETRPE